MPARASSVRMTGSWNMMPKPKISVMLSDKYPIELRTQAALAMVEMERPDIEGVAELQRALKQADSKTRSEIIHRMVPGLIALMRGDSAAAAKQEGEESNAPTAEQVRAKDAAYLLISQADEPDRQQLISAVMNWYMADFNGRSLVGDYSAEQVVRSLGAAAASRLVDAFDAHMPQVALVKTAEIVSDMGDAKAKQQAATRVIAIEKEMESPAFLQWLKSQIMVQLKAQKAENKVDAKRIQEIAEVNREAFINEGALPAMKHLAEQPEVADRLLAIASRADESEAIVERRKRARRSGLDQAHALPVSSNG